ncbi:SMI1/KNR4 family protein [Neolewinella antarctica]|uniref:Knr4/Smi1-like domain-containing protein n=1 Tax=Neolewinella antarctica TaxID=442734 RepID=A0ABX0XH37_9BACT|nr:SMI1/KNR4 family protein [Neolewinella antarctica]NJC28527.1 hypothetical protein [Neolewinella antarctica]
MKLNSHNFWGNNYYRNPSVTEIDIVRAESSLGVKLPPIYLDLIRIQNGGYTNGFIFPMKIMTSWANDHVPLHEMFGIVNPNSTSGHNIMKSHYLTSEWGLPPNQVIINGDGHWWITLDYRKSKEPSIAWIDIECDEDIQIATSFKGFYHDLVSE